MNDAGSTDPVTVASDGVTVRKVLERDRFSTPAIAFTMTSERDDPVVIRLTDPLPEGAALDEVGFHPEYGSQFWTAETDRLTFEYRLDAHEEYETVYGLRAEDPTAFMAEFDLDATAEEAEKATDGIEDVSDVVSAENSQAVRDMIAGGDGSETSDAEVAFEADAGREPTADEPPQEPDAEADVEAEATGIGLPEDDAEEIESDPIDDEGAIGDIDLDEDLGEVEQEPETETEAETDDSPIGAIDDEPQPAEPADGSVDEAVDEAVEDLLGGESAAESSEGGPADPDGSRTTDDAPSIDDSVEASPGNESTGGEGALDEEAAVSDAADEVLGPSVGSDTQDSPADTTTPDSGPDDTVTGTAAPGDDSPDVDIEASTADHEGLVAAIAEEIRAGDVTEDDLATVTEALNQTTPSLESRVRYLQNEMTDLAAYTDALEAFIDEHGNATGVLSELRDGLSDLEDRVADLDSRVSDRFETLDTIEDRLETLAAVEDRVGDVEDRLADQAAEAETLEDELATVRSSVQSLREDLTAVDDLQDDLGSVEEEVSGLADDVRTIESDIESVKEFRERFRTVFAGGDGGGQGQDAE